MLSDTGKVSIIVPVYKSEKSIGRCVESILAQTYRDIELILVDDGGGDSSLSICQGFASCDARVKVISQENGGPARARNTGLDAATGEWISFVDSDDWIDETHIGHLADAMRGGADLAACGYVFWNSTTEETYKYEAANVVTPTDAVSTLMGALKHQYGYIWCKMFKAQIVNDANIRFQPDLNIGEDVFFVTSYMTRVRSLSVVPYSTYHYFFQEGTHWGSTFTLSFSEMERQMRKHVSAYDALFECTKAECIPGYAANEYYRYLFYHYILPNSGQKFPAASVVLTSGDVIIGEPSVVRIDDPAIPLVVRTYFRGVKSGSAAIQKLAVNVYIAGHAVMSAIRKMKVLISGK